MAVAAVLSGKATLPRTEEMRSEYRDRLQRKGTGKMFHSLKDREVEYVNELVDWINEDGKRVGAQLVEGHTVAWHGANAERLEKMRKMREDRARDLNGSA